MNIIPLSQQEITRLRAETKGTGTLVHFNNAGSSLSPDVVVDTMVDYLREEAVTGGYEIEFKYRAELNNVYTSIAKLLNAEPGEIALVENASAAWGIAFNGITFSPGDEIITSENEYVTNILGFLNVQKQQGIVIKVIPNNEHGDLDLAAFENAITARTKMIAVTHIASTTGGMMPIEAIGKIARKHNIIYLLDACQSAGQVPLDVKAIGCDMLAVTGRKYLRAPRGTGFLFVRKDIQDDLKQLLLDGFSIEWITETDFKPKSNAQRFELYERNRALTLGLGKAVDYALGIGIDRIWNRIQHLAGLLRSQLSAIDGLTVTDYGSELCGIVTFTVEGIEAADIKRKLAAKGINVSVGLAKSTLYFMNKNKLASLVRASVHYYNTEDEVQALCRAIGGMAL